ncbi:penicillin-binding transpeptidase domain-containing protein [Lachnoclostridium sp. An118]|uniref:penicillin-binding transpeptidase domain-containing protein n=1 Tax=Lachnoclostridium sp. An118 TaxID=1965547 RepID=UPI0019D1B113|nr:penicillin-binding transpeptidase domain-containing protein [Lachnoclostridium sp. An118]
MFSIWERIKSGIYELFQRRAVVSIIIFCVMFSILVGRLFQLQIVNGQSYLEDYTIQIQKTRTIQGTRGNIYDRNGNLLAYNELAYSVTIEDNGVYNTTAEKNEALNEEITRIIEIVEGNGDSVISDFSIVLDANNEYQFSMTDETQRLRFVADVFGESYIDSLDDEQRNMSAAEIIDYLCTDETYGYGIDQDALDRSQVLKMVNIRYAIGLNSFQKYIPTTVAEDVSDETVAEIMEHLNELQGVDIAEESLRRYTDSKYFANLIGYTGQISQEEYNALGEEEKEQYDLTDTVGKSGLEQVLDSTLQGDKGEVKLYVNSVGRVIDTVGETEPKAGNDVYLTIDANLQKAAYDILEQELAGILLSRMQDILDYDRTQSEDAADVIVASGDAYNAFIDNDIVDMSHFSAEGAGAAEQSVYGKFAPYKEQVLSQLTSIMQDGNASAYRDMSREWQAYLSHVVNEVLTGENGVIMSDAIDTDDETYQQWRNEETINIYTYLNYAISQNWVDASKLQAYLSSEGNYSDSSEVYSAMISYVTDRLSSSTDFDKLIYQYMIKAGTVTGRELCMILYEQGVLPMDETQYNNLASGATGAYDFLRSKIQSLEITPGQLGLEPCRGSVVITDTDSGDVLACVSYPGYDNNRLANTMDSEYYNELNTSTSQPFYNSATQETTAPGSTYKPLVAVAGLTEGAIDTSTTVYCDGNFDVISPEVHCWVYPAGHGTMNVVSGITNSCNEFFNNIGYQLGMQTDGTYSSEYGLERLAKYAELFGLNETSGLEIPEMDPKVSDEDSVRSAMGQGTNNYTTSQLARYITAVANKGTLYELTLLDRVENVDGEVVEEFQNGEARTIEGVSSSTWDAVHAGMEGVVQNSSVFTAINASSMSVSGKTGTAQQSTTHADHGLFVGFAPSDNPEIAMAIRIANGYSSTYASEVGSNIFQYYYQITDSAQLITGQAAEITVNTSGD